MCKFTLFTFLCGGQKLKIASPCAEASTNYLGVPFCRNDPHAHVNDRKLREYADPTWGPGVCLSENCQDHYGLLPYKLEDKAMKGKKNTRVTPQDLVEDDREFDMGPEACQDRENRYFRLLSTDQQLEELQTTFPIPFWRMTYIAQAYLHRTLLPPEFNSLIYFNDTDVLAADPDDLTWQELNPKYLTQYSLHLATRMYYLPASVTDTSKTVEEHEKVITNLNNAINHPPSKDNRNNSISNAPSKNKRKSNGRDNNDDQTTSLTTRLDSALSTAINKRKSNDRNNHSLTNSKKHRHSTGQMNNNNNKTRKPSANKIRHHNPNSSTNPDPSPLTTTPRKPFYGPFAVQSHTCLPAVGFCKKCGIYHGEAFKSKPNEYVRSTWAVEQAVFKAQDPEVQADLEKAVRSVFPHEKDIHAAPSLDEILAGPMPSVEELAAEMGVPCPAWALQGGEMAYGFDGQGQLQGPAYMGYGQQDQGQFHADQTFSAQDLQQPQLMAGDGIVPPSNIYQDSSMNYEVQNPDVQSNENQAYFAQDTGYDESSFVQDYPSDPALRASLQEYHDRMFPMPSGYEPDEGSHFDDAYFPENGFQAGDAGEDDMMLD